MSYKTITRSPESSQNVKEFQLYQDTEGEIILKIVKSGDYSDSDSKTILKKFQKTLGDDFHFSIKFADHIPRTKRGKYQFLIQKLPIDFLHN